MTLPENLTFDILEEAMRESLFGMRMIGFCLSCGEEHDHVEGDAQGYKCLECGKMAVCGVEHIYMSIAF